MPIPKKSTLFESITRDIDERGSILSIVDSEIKNVSIIECKKGVIRSNHYHKKDYHFMYVLNGEIDYFFTDLNREKISLSSYIPRGLEHLSDNEDFLNQIQLFNYKLIELVNPKYLIIMSNFCIKMLLATDLSSMSLRGKWFDFNTPNDVTPKKCRVLYEPEILINNPDLKKDAWEDLKEIKRQLGG